MKRSRLCGLRVAVQGVQSKRGEPYDMDRIVIPIEAQDQLKPRGPYKKRERTKTPKRVDGASMTAYRLNIQARTF